MKHVMLDFETLGNGKNACVVQVGACYFDSTTGEVKETFKRNIDARSSVKNGGEFDADTVYWWLSQSKEAIDSITAAPLVDIVAAMNDLNEFLSDAGAVWSHATFDFVILQETLKKLGIKPKFHYRVARDLRTLVSLARVVSIKTFAREGTHHDALEDCKFQVKYCVAALNQLRSK